MLIGLLIRLRLVVIIYLSVVLLFSETAQIERYISSFSFIFDN
jgi:hypothetical protein